MLSKITFWLTNFLEGLIAIMSSTAVYFFGILMRISDMIIPNNRVFMWADRFSRTYIDEFLEDEDKGE